jgi:hypothetical protein
LLPFRTRSLQSLTAKHYVATEYFAASTQLLRLSQQL